MYSTETIRERLEWLISKHEPSKIGSLDALMKHYKGHLKDLNKRLSEQYEEEYIRVKPVKLKKKYAIGHKIGFGAYSVVRECKIRREWIENERKNNKKRASLTINNVAMHSSSSAASNRSSMKRTSMSSKRSSVMSNDSVGDFRFLMNETYIDSENENENGETMSDNEYNNKFNQYHTQQQQQPRIFAIKIIDKDNLDKADLSMLTSEVAFLRQVRLSDNIVHLHDVFESRSKFCIILDYLSGGQLFDRIIDCGFFNEEIASKLFHQICNALEFIHNLNIIHRDIKPQNLIFDKKSENMLDVKLKLIDFGYAIKHDPNNSNNTPLTEVCGTPNYMAPEMLEEKPYNTKVDIWAAGVILHTMLIGTLPYIVTFDLNNNKNSLKSIENQYNLENKEWEHVSNDAKDLVSKLLERDPNKRIDAKQALSHRWLITASPQCCVSSQNLNNLKLLQYVQRLRRGVRCMIAVCKLIDVLQVYSDDKSNNANNETLTSENENETSKESKKTDE